MIGYTPHKKAYRLLDLETRKIFHSRHVRFDESATIKDAKSSILPSPSEASGQWENLYQPARRTSSSADEHLDDEDNTPRPSHSWSPSPTLVGENTASVGAAPERTVSPTLQPSQGPSQPSPSTPQPTPQVVSVQRPSRNRRPANRNRDVLRTQDEAQARLDARHESQQVGNAPSVEVPDPTANEAPPTALFAHISEDFNVEEMFFAGMADSSLNNHNLPQTYAEAMAGANAADWQGAWDSELSSLAANDVYEVVRIPDGVKPITSKPVFRLKMDSRGNVERFKIRFVARGYVQKEGIDYKEVFAPVANLESVRILLALAAKYDLELDAMDITTAYLNGELEEDLYLLPPKGVKISDGYCWKLKRSLYGLKQAGRTWNKTLDRALTGLGFCRLDAETCLYIYREGKQLCYLVVYVDDLLLAATSRPFMDKVKAKLAAKFKMRDLGKATYALGIEIKRDRRKRIIKLSQRQYIKNVLDRYGMKDCKPISTPMAVNAKITADQPDDNTVHHSMSINGIEVTYPSVVGSLMYAMLGTRPDIAFLVGVLGRFAAAPKKHHWEMAKRALRYLKHTMDMDLCYNGNDVNSDLIFHGFSDADWSGDIDTSRSTSGYVFIANHGAIGWASKRQSMVALSTTESEYIGLSIAGQHLAWLRTFFAELGHPQQLPTDLGNDNMAAIILSKDPQFRARTKHIQRKYHFVRDDLIAKGEAIVRYVPTDDMVADIFTKALPHDKHWKFVTAMGLRLCSSGSVKICRP